MKQSTARILSNFLDKSAKKSVRKIKTAFGAKPIPASLKKQDKI